MPTLKHRINLSVPEELDKAINLLARRDDMPVASMTIDLLRRAIEIEEDEALLAVAQSREAKKVRFVSHARAWK